MRKILVLLIVVLIIATILFTFSNKPKKELTLDQKIGQLFIIGIEGKEVSLETENLIKELHPGGILLLGKNISDEEQVKKLIDDLQKIAIADTGLPLFIAIDQEGGIISRIKWANSTPQSQIKDKDEAYNVGRERARELKDLGINMNLAPLLDAAEKDDFISNRTFEKDAGTLAGQLIRGQKEEGILTAIKHFPGYGGISFNPEDKLAALEKTPEISQFQEALASEPELVMVTDVIYKDIDELPFVFSKNGIGFLREKLPGDYLIISDDLDQYAFLDNFPLSDIVTSPIRAGVDLLIFSGHRLKPDSGINAFKEAILQGKIKEEEIKEKVLRIIGLKEKIK